MKTILLILLASLSTVLAQQPKLPTSPPAESPSPAVAPSKLAKPAPEPVPDDPFVKGGGDAPKPAADPEDNAAQKANFQVLFETFDLSRDDFVALLDTPGDDSARYAKLAGWMASGRSKLVTFTALTVRSGNRTVLESVDEVRFSNDVLTLAAGAAAAFPIEFETRNTGETLELEMTVGPDGRGAVQLAPNFTRLVKFVDEIGSSGQANSAVSQPRFQCRTFTTNLNFMMNQPRLAGTMSGAGDDGALPETVRVAFFTARPSVVPRVKVEPRPVNSTLLRLEYTFFSLERVVARDLWLAKTEPQALYDGVRALVAEKKAKLEHACIQVTPSGNRALTQEHSEIKYPLDFYAPHFLEDESARTNADASDAQPASGTWKKKVYVPPVPKKFEVRNTGFTAEVEPWIEEGDSIVQIQICPQFTRKLGLLEVTGIAKSYPPQTLFELRKFTGYLSAAPGQQQFMSTFNMPVESGVNGRQDDGRVWLGFVRVVEVK